jgi:hypothetical protein
MTVSGLIRDDPLSVFHAHHRLTAPLATALPNSIASAEGERDGSAVAEDLA